MKVSLIIRGMKVSLQFIEPRSDWYFPVPAKKKASHRLVGGVILFVVNKAVCPMAMEVSSRIRK
jgi:hypothetical protein